MSDNYYLSNNSNDILIKALHFFQGNGLLLEMKWDEATIDKRPPEVGVPFDVLPVLYGKRDELAVVAGTNPHA
jgi:hypothetical protein